MMLETFLVRVGRHVPSLSQLALQVSEHQSSFYQKSLAFDEEEVVYTMTSEFLTLIVTFLKKKLQSSLLQGRQACQSAAFVKLSEIRAHFVIDLWE